MTSGAVPFHFDLTEAIARAQRLVSAHVGDVTLNLPFISVAVSPHDREKMAAREIVIRMRDYRVLSGAECCDHCIDSSVASLQDIRRLLVDPQMALSDLRDGPLFLLVDIMHQGIRQFLTYDEHLRAAPDDDTPGVLSDFRRQPRVREAYFAGLEQLRGHLSRSMHEVRKVADMPEADENSAYATSWPLQQYVAPELSGPERRP